MKRPVEFLQLTVSLNQIWLKLVSKECNTGTHILDHTKTWRSLWKSGGWNVFITLAARGWHAATAGSFMSPVMRQGTSQDVYFRRDELARKDDVIPFHLRAPTFLTGGNRSPQELGITQTQALQYVKATKAVTVTYIRLVKGSNLNSIR